MHELTLILSLNKYQYNKSTIYNKVHKERNIEIEYRKVLGFLNSIIKTVLIYIVESSH